VWPLRRGKHQLHILLFHEDSYKKWQKALKKGSLCQVGLSLHSWGCQIGSLDHTSYQGCHSRGVTDWLLVDHTARHRVNRVLTAK
jgi:hypothetical protein